MISPTARSIDTYLHRHASPLAGLGSVFETAGAHYGVDPNLLVAIAGAETDFGTNPKAAGDVANHNAWGWGPGIKFSSWPAAIDTIARGLKTNYLDQGHTTIPQIGAKWAPAGAANDPSGLNHNWAINVGNFYGQLTGRTTPTLTPAATPATLTPAARSNSADEFPLLQMISNNQKTAGLPGISPLILELLAGDTAAPAAAAPTPAAALPGAGSAVPVIGKIIGKPYQGTHAVGFNDTHGSGNWESENAIDVAAPVGSPVRALTGGVIGPQFGSLGEGGRFAGLRLHILSPDNEAYYAHLSRFAPGIKPGSRVTPGQVIGYSGEANGVAHLHLALRKGDPLSLYA